MKKLLVLVMAFAFFAGSAFAAGEVNVKLGLDPFGNVKIDFKGDGDSESVKFGFNLSAEYLYPVHEIVKVGAGLEYLFEREVDIDADVDDGPKFSYLPIFATVKVNPINPAPEVFFKGNIGYNILFDANYAGADTKGGLYWALGAGYEFDFGLVLEAMYGFYYSKVDYDGGGSIDFTYSKLGINVGYKFKL